MSQNKQFWAVLGVSLFLTAALFLDAHRRFKESEVRHPSPQLVRLMGDSHPSKQK